MTDALKTLARAVRRACVRPGVHHTQSIAPTACPAIHFPVESGAVGSSAFVAHRQN